MTPPRLHIEALRRGDIMQLRVLRAASARAVVFDQEAAPLTRLLAAGASGVMQPDLIASTIERQPDLRAGVVALGDGVQTGDIAIGQVAGRDVVTINVYVGPQ